MVTVITLILALLNGLVVVITTIISVSLKERVLERSLVLIIISTSFSVGAGACIVLSITSIFASLSRSLFAASAVRLAVLAVGLSVQLECKPTEVISLPVVAGKARKVDITDGCLASITFAGVIRLLANVHLGGHRNAVTGGAGGWLICGCWLGSAWVDASGDGWLRSWRWVGGRIGLLAT